VGDLLYRISKEDKPSKVGVGNRFNDESGCAKGINPESQRNM
jgi:hypothetical protein